MNTALQPRGLSATERLAEMLRDKDRVQTIVVHAKDDVPFLVERLPVQPGHREMTLAMPVLLTRDEWVSYAVDVRFEVAVALMLPNGTVTSSDMLEVLPGSTLAYLEYWQQQVLTGACWHAGTRVGETAAGLTEKGYLLHARRKLKDFYGRPQPTRYKEKQGEIGTDAFVLKVMGPEYLRWLKAIE